MSVKKVEVEMHAFAEGRIRTVEIPSAEFGGSVNEKLERVFYYGQNDFQPQRMPSVSVNDIVRLDGKRYRVASMGFEEVVEPMFVKGSCQTCGSMFGARCYPPHTAGAPRCCGQDVIPNADREMMRGFNNRHED